MNKIGIITIQDFNYGNRLQCYAVQIILESLKYFPVNLMSLKYIQSKKSTIKRIFNILFLNKNQISSEKRMINFYKFEKNIHHLDRKNIDLCSLKNDYLKFVTGSDQVWHPEWFGDEKYFLQFCPEHKRVSLSASFGVSEISNNKKEIYKNYLKKFNHISVREEAGAKIIKDLTGRDAIVLVDPTMLLTQDEWREVSKKPMGAKKGYILTYFLSPKCDEAKNKLKEISGDKEVYEFLNPNDKVAGTAGPSEFLWLFDNADMILTDSFHACVFSFLFNKPFIIYDRNWNEGNMNSRLETLLSKFKLERKYANSGLDNNIWEHNYEEGYKQLEIERKKAMDFLREALEN